MKTRHWVVAIVSVLLLAACAETRYARLPPSRQLSNVTISNTDNEVRRVVPIITKLVRARPLPVEQVLVVSSAWLDRQAGKKVADPNNAGARRCGKGEPPPNGCVTVGVNLMAKLSPDAMAGILAHELGHLEAGHKGGYTNVATGQSVAKAGESLCNSNANSREAAIAALIGCGFQAVGMGGAAVAAGHSRDHEREADTRGLERLSAAGYCAGPTMKKVWSEFSRLFPNSGKADLFSTHPSFAERWQNAGTSCSG